MSNSCELRSTLIPGSFGLLDLVPHVDQFHLVVTGRGPVALWEDDRRVLDLIVPVVVPHGVLEEVVLGLEPPSAQWTEHHDAAMPTEVPLVAAEVLWPVFVVGLSTAHSLLDRLIEF